MKKVFLLHENKTWSKPLEMALDRIGVPNIGWYMVDRLIDMSIAPPDGIFFNRMSASSHSRGHRYAPELTLGLLAWLESNDRLVVNGSKALHLELSKIVQYSALRVAKLNVPRTIAATNFSSILEASKSLEYPVIIKHNRAGKGMGVKLFHNELELKNYVFGEKFEPSIDGITLIQDYIKGKDETITRVEFVDQQLLYALRVDTSDGFKLCPDDSCEVTESDIVLDRNTLISPKGKTKFEIIDGFASSPVARRIVPPMKRLMKTVGIHVASFEFIIDRNNDVFVYDINVNTNYNNHAERKSDVSGVDSVAKFMARLARQ